MKTSRKDLVQQASYLDAVRIATNIYEFENKIYEITKDCKMHHIVAYSYGIYGNTGRLDMVQDKNGVVKYYYY